MRDGSERQFTKRVSVRLLFDHHKAISDALGEGVGIGSSMRDAGLRAIGRKDLIVEVDEPEARRWGNPKKTSAKLRDYKNVGVNLTDEQWDALDEVARKRGLAISALLRDPLLKELGLPPVEALERWYPLGRRRSSPPGTKPGKVPRKRKRARQ